MLIRQESQPLPFKDPNDGRELALALGLPQPWVGKATPLLRKKALRILAMLIIQFTRHHDSQLAATIAYYGFLSIFPLLLLLTIIASHFILEATVQLSIDHFVTHYLPVAQDLINSNVQLLFSQRHPISILAVIGLLWSASGVFSNLIFAINQAWNEKELPVYWLQRLLSILIVVIIILLFFAGMIFSMILHFLADIYLPSIPFIGEQLSELLHWGSSLAPPLLDIFTFWALYKVVPVTNVPSRAALMGAIFTAIAIELSKWGFLWYLGNIAHYGIIYGSMSTIVVFLFWSYLLALIILSGAELSAICGRIANRAEREHCLG